MRRQPTDDSSDLAWLSRLPEKNWRYHLLAEWWGQIHLSSMEDPALIPSTYKGEKNTSNHGTDFQATALERPH